MNKLKFKWKANRAYVDHRCYQKRMSCSIYQPFMQSELRHPKVGSRQSRSRRYFHASSCQSWRRIIFWLSVWTLRVSLPKCLDRIRCIFNDQRRSATAQTCYCGDPSCTGIIGGGRASSEDRNVSEEDDTTVAKKPGRKPALHPIKSLRELPIFAKEMLESGGKLPLVHRLLSRLELTLPTADAKLILREFIRLRGITLLKIWLSEWKAEQEIVLKILQLLDSLPIQYRNKVEESKIFDTLGRFVDHENEDIKTLAKSLMDKWSVLQIYFRIPKLVRLWRPDLLILLLTLHCLDKQANTCPR